MNTSTNSIYDPGIFLVFFNTWSFYLPYIVYSIWAPLSIYDLSQRTDIETKKGIFWIIFILLVPFIGAGTYLMAGGAQLKSWLRLALVIGAGGLIVLSLIISSAFRI